MAIFYGLEDQRDLSTQIRYFRNAIVSHIKKLLEARRIYWRKMANTRRANLGDENTKISHAISIQSYRNILIASIKCEDGRIKQDHEQKAAILWQSFKDGLGISLNPTTLFNIDHLTANQTPITWKIHSQMKKLVRL